ncbi:sugar O-acetyltransferase [Pectobacterium jejuense]|uniref:sugar O-acetyltransferase n=1 Tax=Pectobacterium jejuense TaxID=2974022 RepID=UPI00227DC254|nr:sugar O-acetyltransferase [Pectobacterium jejuense]MCY9848582.1 sugar O-acetyltransferase [Pectobacterium jejuense]
MNEAEKAAAGLLYDANYDEALLRRRDEAKQQLFEFNHTPVTDKAKRQDILHNLLGRHGENFIIEGPFYCDYGYNIEIVENFYANVNFVVLDGAKVKIGDNVFIAPNVGIYTAGHPLDAKRRNQGLEYAHPVTIGDNVWIGAGVNILPGVSIGSNSIIGAGAVVLHSVPEGVLVAGNPARIIRKITEEDSLRYQ